MQCSVYHIWHLRMLCLWLNFQVRTSYEEKLTSCNQHPLCRRQTTETRYAWTCPGSFRLVYIRYSKALWQQPFLQWFSAIVLRTLRKKRVHVEPVTNHVPTQITILLFQKGTLKNPSRFSQKGNASDWFHTCPLHLRLIQLCFSLASRHRLCSKSSLRCRCHCLGGRSTQQCRGWSGLVKSQRWCNFSWWDSYTTTTHQR